MRAPAAALRCLATRASRATRFGNPFDRRFGQATVAARAGDRGSAYQGVVAVSPGVWLYQVTDKGVVLELTAKGKRYYKYANLN